MPDLGKLIIDDVVVLVQTPGRPETLRAWWDSGLLNWLGLLLAAEFAMAVLADILGRLVSLIDSLLSERVTNASSIRLMEHAATLDLEDFENAEFQDQLERARRWCNGPSSAQRLRVKSCTHILNLAHLSTRKRFRLLVRCARPAGG